MARRKDRTTTTVPHTSPGLQPSTQVCAHIHPITTYDIMTTDRKLSLDGHIYQDCDDHWFYKIDSQTRRHHTDLPQIPTHTTTDRCTLCNTLQRITHPDYHIKAKILCIGEHDYMNIEAVSKETGSKLDYPDHATTLATKAQHTVACWPNATYPLQNQRDQTRHRLQKGNPTHLLLASSNTDIQTLVTLYSTHQMTYAQVLTGVEASARNTLAIAEQSLQQNPAIQQVIIITYLPNRHPPITRDLPNITQPSAGNSLSDLNPNVKDVNSKDDTKEIYQRARTTLTKAQDTSPYKKQIILDPLSLLYQTATDDPETIFGDSNTELMGDTGPQYYTLNIITAINKALNQPTNHHQLHHKPTHRPKFYYWQETPSKRQVNE